MTARRGESLSVLEQTSMRAETFFSVATGSPGMSGLDGETPCQMGLSLRSLGLRSQTHPHTAIRICQSVQGDGQDAWG